MIHPENILWVWHNSYMVGEFVEDVLTYPVYKTMNDPRIKGDYCFACSNLKAKQILVFEEFFELPEECRGIILLHEIAHHLLQTSDEEKCDQYAASHYKNGQYWLEETRKRTQELYPIIQARLGIA